MRILVFNGSARKMGFTEKMLNFFLAKIEGTVDIIHAYDLKISPCKDCRYCWHKRGCSEKDEMQEIYEKIDAADLIVFASPVYFHSITGPLKVLIDRLQVYWAGVLRDDKDGEKEKLGAFLLCGGAPAFPNQFLGAEIVLSGVLGDLRAECVGQVRIANTDKAVFEEDIPALLDIECLAEKIRRIHNLKVDSRQDRKG
ncbi:MAG: flavodoxin family protein [Spirochaetales bacterium]|nr:flavodoxin family protein [Spirochaetales bacterium]